MTGGQFEILASHNLRLAVRHDYLRYMTDLLEDFHERAKQDPAALFRQLSSLSIGPLVTHKVGTCGVDDAYLASTCLGFVSVTAVAGGTKNKG